MKLLFSQTSQRFYFFGENESMILLFGVGREYDFAESGGTGTLFQMPRFFFCKIIWYRNTKKRTSIDR